VNAFVQLFTMKMDEALGTPCVSRGFTLYMVIDDVALDEER